jgi:hypothetical protein
VYRGFIYSCGNTVCHSLGVCTCKAAEEFDPDYDDPLASTGGYLKEASPHGTAVGSHAFTADMLAALEGPDDVVGSDFGLASVPAQASGFVADAAFSSWPHAPSLGIPGFPISNGLGLGSWGGTGPVSGPGPADGFHDELKAFPPLSTQPSGPVSHGSAGGLGGLLPTSVSRAAVGPVASLPVGISSQGPFAPVTSTGTAPAQRSAMIPDPVRPPTDGVRRSSADKPGVPGVVGSAAPTKPTAPAPAAPESPAVAAWRKHCLTIQRKIKDIVLIEERVASAWLVFPCGDLWFCVCTHRHERECWLCVCPEGERLQPSQVEKIKKKAGLIAELAAAEANKPNA